jgi:hypothetical protein
VGERTEPLAEVCPLFHPKRLQQQAAEQVLGWHDESFWVNGEFTRALPFAGRRSFGH